MQPRLLPLFHESRADQEKYHQLRQLRQKIPS